ncbi:phosphatase PAP2 family protein [Gluconobacter wancherniae]|uniref:acid phosphatase n=1 Tax=Gluconobacter wancherniae TaxID=1307955 RepID=UPI0030B05782
MIRPSYFAAVLLTCATALPVLSYCAVEMYFVPDPVPEHVLPDGRQFLAGPPDRQSAAFQDDLRVFHATRALKDSPRWRLARLDADHSDTALARDFSCAAGFRIDLAETPHLVRFLRRSRHAIRRRVTEEKHLWHRTRPFVGNDLPVCVGKNTDLDGHASYPSGHATAGFTMALLLADLLPDQREAIMTRGHVFGESRLVCGVHWKSDVEAGFRNGMMFMQALKTDPALKGDLEMARQELAQARLRGLRPDPEECALEADAALHPVIPRQ